MIGSMTPAIVEKEGKLFLVAVSPGGSTIPASVFQVIINMIDYNMTINESVDTGRFHHQWLPDHISYERNSIDTLAMAKLTRIGHNLLRVGSLDRVNAICIPLEGLMEGAADKRGDNSACGY